MVTCIQRTDDDNKKEGEMYIVFCRQLARGWQVGGSKEKRIKLMSLRENVIPQNLLELHYYRQEKNWSRNRRDQRWIDVRVKWKNV